MRSTASPSSDFSLGRWIRTSPILTAFITFMIALVATCYWAATRPNFEVEFTREVPSNLTPEYLGHALEDLSLWPEYYYGLKQARVLGGAKNELETGREIQFDIEPVGKEWKRFQMQGRIVSHVPGRLLEVELLGDSAGKMSKLFDHFLWKFEILPADTVGKMPAKSLLRGTAEARTSHWRGRMFGKLMPKIMMNQAFYIDLVTLGTLDRHLEAKKESLPPSFQ